MHFSQAVVYSSTIQFICHISLTKCVIFCMFVHMRYDVFVWAPGLKTNIKPYCFDKNSFTN